MIDWMKKFFGQPPSSSTAKERLRLVLMTDHLALAPDIIENMKRDLVDVISRYVEVDREKVEVNFEREDKALAMLANIPITAVNRPAVKEECHPERSVEPSEDAQKKDEPKSEASPAAAPAAAPTASHGGPPPQRRRRRKKPASHATARPASS